jgi:hypothetical protein
VEVDAGVVAVGVAHGSQLRILCALRDANVLLLPRVASLLDARVVERSQKKQQAVECHSLRG